jgi:hypothetical protein
VVTRRNLPYIFFFCLFSSLTCLQGLTTLLLGINASHTQREEKLYNTHKVKKIPFCFLFTLNKDEVAALQDEITRLKNELKRSEGVLYFVLLVILCAKTGTASTILGRTKTRTKKRNQSIYNPNKATKMRIRHGNEAKCRTGKAQNRVGGKLQKLKHIP